MTGTASLLHSADPPPFASARPASNTRGSGESGFPKHLAVGLLRGDIGGGHIEELEVQATTH